MAVSSEMRRIAPTRRAMLAGCLCAALALPAWSQSAPGRVIELSIVARKVEGAEVKAGGRGTGSAGVLRVARGDAIELVWSSDEAVTLHLHGYDVETRVAAGGKGSMRFDARATGRFAIETHGIGADKRRHMTLVYVEVHPR